MPDDTADNVAGLPAHNNDEVLEADTGKGLNVTAVAAVDVPQPFAPVTV